MKSSLIGFVLLWVGTAAWAQQVLYQEHYTGGQMALTWQAAFNGNNMQALADPTTPEPDGWVGKVGNNLSGGNVGLTYAGDSLLSNTTLSAWVYTIKTATSGGPYNSLVFRMRMTSDSMYQYYQYDSDFDTDSRLRFRKFGDTTGYAQVLHDWPSAQIPGGAPAVSGWHLMRVRQQGNQFWFWFDGYLLPGCPYSDNTGSPLTNGYFGAYIFQMSSTSALTKVDGVIVTDNVVGIYLNPTASYPIVIPASGGVLNYNAQLINHTAASQIRIVWVRMRNPDGTWTPPILGPITVNLPLNANIARMRSINIPSTWAPGSYTVRGYVGTSMLTPLDSSSFIFYKGALDEVSPGLGPTVFLNELFPGEEIAASPPSTFGMMIAAPNPFNATTVASFELRVPSYVSLKVYDTSGRIVAALIDGWREAGTHEAAFEGSNLASGIYLARLEVREFSAVQKLVLLK
jgi:hypothetical protein